MKINCDVGEGFTRVDKAIMPYIDLANIACGGHTGDTQSMSHIIELGLQYNTKLGAHPSYPDQKNFGRISQNIPMPELTQQLLEQIGTLEALCKQYQTTLYHIKPHGALYNDLLQNPALYKMLLNLIATHFPSTLLVIQACPNQAELLHMANQYNVSILFEAFADRRYTDNGFLQARSNAGAVLTNSSDIYEQAKTIIQNQTVTTVTNKRLLLNAKTLCIHGDNPSATQAVKKIRALI